MTTDQHLDDLLRFDGLDAAEKMTGASYKTDEGTMALGFLLHATNAEERNAALAARDDTTFSTKTDRYLRIAADEGFRIVLADTFTDPNYGEPRDETFYVLWHDDGVLLKFDTYYGGESVNSGTYCYNFRFPQDEDARKAAWRVLSSHGPVRGHDGIRTGYHDCREALRHNLAALRAAGDLVTPWVEPPFPSRYLLTFVEWKLDDPGKAAAAAARLARLPEDVRKAMGVQA